MTEVQSSILLSIPGLHHGFGTTENPVPTSLLSAWERRASWKQVHGHAFAEVTTTQQSCGEVDALGTRSPGIPIAVATADCVPILLAREDGQAAVAIHAGWRGTFQRIVEKVWAQLQNQGEIPSRWLAAIGPSIGPCCYEVNSELMLQFRGEFSAEPASLFGTTPNRNLDLPTLNAHLLTKLGIHRCEVLRHCTRCSTDPRFFSYRRGDLTARQWSGALLSSSSSTANFTHQSSK